MRVRGAEFFNREIPRPREIFQTGFLVAKNRKKLKWTGKMMEKVSMVRTGTARLPDNALCLCFSCHKRKWHIAPLQAVRWLDQRNGQDFNNNLVTASLQPFALIPDSFADIQERLKLN